MPDMSAIIFVPALAGSAIFGFVFALFAAHHYLSVVQSAGAGARDVVWVSEPIVDHFWKVFYLLWLIGLWLGPAYFIGRAYTSGSDSTWLRLAVPLAVFWVCYPISQLSSLSAATIWLPLTPDVFGRLAQKPGVTLGFYLCSAAVLAVFGVAFQWTFLTANQYERLFVGAPLLIASGLLYGRLVGRLAFVLAYTKPLLSPKKKRKRDRDEDAADEAERPRVRQPSERPPIQTPDEGPITGYDLTDDEEPPKKPRKRVRAEAAEPDPEPVNVRPRRPAKPSGDRSRRWTDDDEDKTPYGMTAAEVVPEEPKPAADVAKPSAEEMRLISKDDVPKPPKQAWTPQLMAFLVQPDTLAVVGLLSLMCIMTGLMVRICRQFNPAAGS